MTISELKNTLCIKAFHKWGAKVQISKALEELTELLLALQHYPKKATREDILEEVADVEIILHELKLILNISDEELNNVVNKKLCKLEKLLES